MYVCLCMCGCEWVLVRLPCPRAQPRIPSLPHLNTLRDLPLPLGFQCHRYTDDSQPCICSPQHSLLNVRGTCTVDLAFSLAFDSGGGFCEPAHPQGEKPHGGWGAHSCASTQTLLHSALSVVGAHARLQEDSQHVKASLKTDALFPKCNNTKQRASAWPTQTPEERALGKVCVAPHFHGSVGSKHDGRCSHFTASQLQCLHCFKGTCSS